MEKVLIIQRLVPDYRAPFFSELHKELAKKGVSLSLLAGAPRRGEAFRDGCNQLCFVEKTKNVHLFGPAYWMLNVRIAARDVDLVVFEQANGGLHHYGILLRRYWGKKVRCAFWGHGAHLNKTRPHPLRDAWRNFWLTKVDWWFAYTPVSAKIVLDQGFPAERVTTVQNAIDTVALIDARKGLTDSQLAALRQELFNHSANAPTGVFCGRLVAYKAIPFLLETIIKVKKEVPDFRMVIVGDGPARPQVDEFCKNNPWCVCVGAQYGAARVPYLSLGDVWLNPGLAGLSILDSFALGIPFFTVESASHGPEIDYLDVGVNGDVSVPEVNAFAEMVAGVLQDTDRLQNMKTAAQAAGRQYTMKNMVTNFTEGVLKALKANRGRENSSLPEQNLARRGKLFASGSKVDLSHETKNAAAKKVLIIHRALPPYRADFFNDVALRIPGVHLFFLLGQMPCHPIPLESFNVNYGYTIGTRKVYAEYVRHIQILVFPALLRTLFKQRPDTIVTNEFGFITIFLALYCRCTGARHVAWTDDSLDNATQCEGIRAVSRKLALKLSSSLIVCNLAVREYFQKRLPYKVSCVEILQKEDVFRRGLHDARSVANQYVEQYHLSGKKVVLFVGRLVGVKNLSTLVRAFAKAEKEDVLLVLVGSGPVEAELQALAAELGISDRTVFAGAKYKTDLSGWYLVGGLFVLPSSDERFGAVVNEALLAGMPVLCSKHAGASCLIKEGYNGTVFNPDDAENFSRILSAWIDQIPKTPPCLEIRDSLMHLRYEDAVERFVESCLEESR